MACVSQGSTAHGILQARIPELGAISHSRRSSWPRGRTHIYCISCIGRWIPYQWRYLKVQVTQSCPTLCNPMDYRVHGILQARILEWVSFPFSRGSSPPRDRTQVSGTAGGFFTSWATREACYKVGQHPSPILASEGHTLGTNLKITCRAFENRANIGATAQRKLTGICHPNLTRLIAETDKQTKVSSLRI